MTGGTVGSRFRCDDLAIVAEDDATSEKCTVGLNGFVEFEMFSEPHVTCGEMVPRKDRDCYSS